MSYVIYHKESTRYLPLKNRYKNTFEREQDAKAAITIHRRQLFARHRKLSATGSVYDKQRAEALLVEADDLRNYRIADFDTFKKTIEKKEIRTGIVGSAGKTFEVPVNESWTSGPWSETYWAS